MLKFQREQSRTSGAHSDEGDMTHAVEENKLVTGDKIPSSERLRLAASCVGFAC
jgi:hypothetical protein